MIRKELQHLAIEIDEVHTHPSNVRQGDVGAICESLKAHGQYRPIVYQQSTKRILAGNHTWKAAKALGWQQIAATPIICDDQQALRILLADNKANDLATYDEPELIELLKQLADTSDGLLGTLFDEDELDSLIEDNSHFELPTEVDDLPEGVPAVSKLGDIWMLGDHRVMCGESTDADQVKQLMNGLQADLVWTDPPYGVDIQERDMAQANVRGRRKDGKGVMNDDLKGNDLYSFLHKAFTNGKEHTKAGGCWYVASPPGDLMMQFGNALLDLGLARHSLVWVKDSLVMGRADYHYRHEVLFYGWKEGAAHHAPPDRKQDSVWEIPRPKRSPEHPTMKPVELIVKAIKNSTNQNEIVLDLFGGSGSTLIAAEETNRIGYLMELDPRYVDVICARYQQHTGNQPVLKSTGEAHDFTPDAD